MDVIPVADPRCDGMGFNEACLRPRAGGFASEVELRVVDSVEDLDVLDWN